MSAPVLDPRAHRALLFDLDGVLTPTADLHRRAWAAMFTDYLDAHGLEPYRDEDYFTYLDGRRRDEGIAALLASRGVTLPHGEDTTTSGVAGADPASTATSASDTVVGLGHRKNAEFLRLLAAGIDPYPGSIAFLDALPSPADGGPELAVVSSSRNAQGVLASAGLTDRFPLVVDGNTAADLDLAGKPAPDTFRYAAEQLGLAPVDCAVIEDALSGIAAGAAGGFGAVIGVDRGAGRRAMIDAGATVVVDDLEDLVDTRGEAGK